MSNSPTISERATPGSAATRQALAWLGLVAALALSCAAFTLSTKHGMGLGNDSRAFLGPALAHLRGEPSISLHHPPLFGWLIGAVARITHYDIAEAVRCIQIVATLALVIGVWSLLRWTLPEYPAAAGAGALLIATSFPVVELGGNVGSDQLGAALTVWSMVFLIRYLSPGQSRYWLLPCLLTAAVAFLNRFAAFGLALSISAVLWLRRGRPLGRDFFAALAAGCVMVAPCVVFLVKNVATTGHATSREVVWNGLPWDRICEAFATISLWFLPVPFAGWPAGLALLVAGVAIGFVTKPRWSAAPRAECLLFSSAAFIGANLLFLVTAISLIDFDLALDSRTLLPWVPVTIILGVTLMTLTVDGTTITRLIAMVVLLALLGMSARRTATLVASFSVLGRGHLGVTALQSPLPGFVSSHPDATFITNNPPRFFNFTRIAALEIPAEISILTNRRDSQFEGKLSSLRERLRAGAPSYLVIFDDTDVKTRADPNGLMAGDPFARVLNDYFVAIYQFAPRRGGNAK